MSQPDPEVLAYQRMLADPSGVEEAYLAALDLCARKAGGYEHVITAEKARLTVLNRYRKELGLPPEPYPWER